TRAEDAAGAGAMRALPVRCGRNCSHGAQARRIRPRRATMTGSCAGDQSTELASPARSGPSPRPRPTVNPQLRQNHAKTSRNPRLQPCDAPPRRGLSRRWGWLSMPCDWRAFGHYPSALNSHSPNRLNVYRQHDGEKGAPMILVTGATGQNGSAAIREFARRGEPVRALVGSAAKAVSMGAPASVEVVEGDMRRAETLGAALN